MPPLSPNQGAGSSASAGGASSPFDLASLPHNSVAHRLVFQYGLSLPPNNKSTTASCSQPFDTSASAKGAPSSSSSPSPPPPPEHSSASTSGRPSRPLPPFIEGKPLKEAIRECNAKAKYTLAYLHAGDHEDTHHFATTVLTNEAVAAKISDIAVCYFVDAYSAEGAALEAMWGATQLPFIALLVKGRYVGDIQGRFSAEDFLQFLSDCDDIARPIIHQEVAFIYERELRERLRAQHEREMAEAEQIDRERLAAAKRAEEERRAAAAERERREAEERRERAEREAAEQAEAEARRIKEAEDRRRAEEAALELETIKAAAASALPEEPPATADAALVAKIRLVDLRGRPFNRAFNRTDPLAALYTYAKTVDGYDGGAFALMAGFPPKPLVSEAEALAAGTLIGDVPSLVPRSVVTMKGI